MSKWKKYCLDNWLNEQAGAGYSCEKKVKAFLDACAFILLQDNKEDTLSRYKEMINGKREIPVSSCPPLISHLLESGYHCEAEDMDEAQRYELMLDRLDSFGPPLSQSKRNREERAETRSDRLEAIRSLYPGCVFHHCRIDTENHFEFDGEWFAVDTCVEEYNPIETKHGLLYDSDQVIVVVDEDGISHFFTQQVWPIDDALVDCLS